MIRTTIDFHLHDGAEVVIEADKDGLAALADIVHSTQVDYAMSHGDTPRTLVHPATDDTPRLVIQPR